MTELRKVFKGSPIIHTYKHIIEIRFREIREYIEELDRFLTTKGEEVNEYVEEVTQSASSDEEKSEIAMFFYEDYCKYNETYRALLLHSTLISSYSAFESLLNQICQVVGRKISSKVKINDLKDNGIDRCRNYLIKVIEIDIEEMNADWDSIKNYQKIRNFIVHNHSNYFIDKAKSIEKQPMHNYISQHDFLKIKYDGKGIFQISDSKYILEFCNCAEKYLQTVINKIRIHFR